MAEAIKEARILKDLCHPNIVEFKVGVCSVFEMIQSCVLKKYATRDAYAGSIRGTKVPLPGDGVLRLR